MKKTLAWTLVAVVLAAAAWLLSKRADLWEQEQTTLRTDLKETNSEALRARNSINYKFSNLEKNIAIFYLYITIIEKGEDHG